MTLAVALLVLSQSAVPAAPGVLAGVAVEVTVEDLTELLDPIREETGVPALAAAILTGNGLTGLGAVGVRRLRDRARVGPDDRWLLASCAKSMTATLFALLAERGEVSWDLTLGEAFPELAEEMFAGYRHVTLETVLAHRAGLPFLPPPELVRRLHDFDPLGQRRRIARSVLSKRPINVPGTATRYSNAGYAIVGAALENATGESWEALMQREIFDRLGMESAGFGPPGDPVYVDEPWGHALVEGELEPLAPIPGAGPPAGFGPAGTIHANLRDWSRYLALHLGALQGAPRLLSARTFERLHTPPSGSVYALGWARLDLEWARGPVLGHTGSEGHWYAVCYVAPGLDAALLVATNCEGEIGPEACQRVVAALVERVAARQRAEEPAPL